MTEDKIAAHLQTLIQEVKGLRTDVVAMDKTLAVQVNGAKELDRRVTQLESDIRWGRRTLLSSLAAWIGTVVWYLLTAGGKG